MRSQTFYLAALLLGTVGVVNAQTPVAVSVNGDAVTFTGQPPVSQNGRLLVPLRGVLEKIGATVRYSGPTKTITAVKGDTTISLTLGETAATVNSRSVSLDVPAQAVNGSTLVPLRFVAEALGADVKYDGAARQVAIRTDGKPNVIVPTKPAEPVAEGKPAPKPAPAPGGAQTFTGIFVDFVQKPEQSDTTISLKMTDGRTLTLVRGAELVYMGQKIGWDDLRSGDKVVATLGAESRGVSAVVSDTEE